MSASSSTGSKARTPTIAAGASISRRCRWSICTSATATTLSRSFLTGAFAGVRLFIFPIIPAALWRLHIAPRDAGTLKDRARPTAVTRKPAPARWRPVAARQGMTRQLAAIGMQAPFYGDQMQREFGFEIEPGDDGDVP
jgi:hypothetical protein